MDMTRWTGCTPKRRFLDQVNSGYTPVPKHLFKASRLAISLRLDTEEKEAVVSSSILAQFANSDEDWLSRPPEQRLIDDEILEWLVGDVLPTDEGSDDFNLAEEEPPKPKKSRFDTVNVTSESKLATFSEGFVPQNTKASTNWALRTLMACASRHTPKW